MAYALQSSVAAATRKEHQQVPSMQQTARDMCTCPPWEIYSEALHAGLLHLMLMADCIALCFRVPEECPREVADVITSCLDENPTNRPTARQIVDRLGGLREPRATH